MDEWTGTSIDVQDEHNYHDHIMNWRERPRSQSQFLLHMHGQYPLTTEVGGTSKKKRRHPFEQPAPNDIVTFVRINAFESWRIDEAIWLFNSATQTNTIVESNSFSSSICIYTAPHPKTFHHTPLHPPLPDLHLCSPTPTPPPPPTPIPTTVLLPPEIPHHTLPPIGPLALGGTFFVTSPLCVP